MAASAREWFWHIELSGRLGPEESHLSVNLRWASLNLLRKIALAHRRLTPHRRLWRTRHKIAGLIVARSLLRRRQLPIGVSHIIAKSRVSDQFATADGVDDYLNRAERAVALVVGRVVADDVLRAQVFGDLGGDGWNLADVFREIGLPARIVGDAREQLLSLLRGRFPEEALLLHLFVNEADQIDLHLVLLDRLHHFLLFDRAVLLQTVGDYDQGLAAALALLLRVIGGGDDRVQQRR